MSKERPYIFPRRKSRTFSLYFRDNSVALSISCIIPTRLIVRKNHCFWAVYSVLKDLLSWELIAKSIFLSIVLTEAFNDSNHIWDFQRRYTIYCHKWIAAYFSKFQDLKNITKLSILTSETRTYLHIKWVCFGCGFRELEHYIIKIL